MLSSLMAKNAKSSSFETREFPYTPQEIEAIFQRFERANPHPQTELAYKNPFTLLIAVVLSAQSTDIGVNRATGALFAVADSPEKMLELGEEKLKDFIKTINLYNGKARNIIRLCEILLSEHGGAVPADQEALERLPGVGHKTANVVLNQAFGQPTLAVDTHIFRLGNRLRLAPGKTPRAVEEAFLHIIPKAYLGRAHHWLILHGRYVCKARRPECARCLIADLCKSPEKTVAFD